MSIDDLSDDEEDVLRALWHMTSIEAHYRVPPHLVAAAKHLQRKGLVREVPWRGPNPPACGTALELLSAGGTSRRSCRPPRRTRPSARSDGRSPKSAGRRTR